MGHVKSNTAQKLQGGFLYLLPYVNTAALVQPEDMGCKFMQIRYIIDKEPQAMSKSGHMLWQACLPSRALLYTALSGLSNGHYVGCTTHIASEQDIKSQP
jgi:hypothetical protein